MPPVFDADHPVFRPVSTSLRCPHCYEQLKLIPLIFGLTDPALEEKAQRGTAAAW